MGPTQEVRAELEDYARADLDWDRLDGSTVLVTGATGLLGSYVVDLLLTRDAGTGAGTTVVATGRSLDRLRARFAWHGRQRGLVLRQVDAERPAAEAGWADHVVHCAGNARPETLRDDPVGTLVGTVTSTDALLRASLERPERRTVVLSSSEVYGAPRPAGPPLREADLGPLDLLAPRSAYPVAKRAAENLCAGYVAQYGVWAAAARPAYVYGPTAAADDTRLVPQLADQALRKGVVTLASDGLVRRSYCYVADCVTALLLIATRGTSGVAYNVTDPGAAATVREVAGIIAATTGARVEFAEQDHAGRTGPGPDQGVLDPSRLLALGWSPRTDLREGLRRSVAARR